jgi:hypothetical protein
MTDLSNSNDLIMSLIRIIRGGNFVKKYFMKKILLVTVIQFLFIQKGISQNERIYNAFQVEVITRYKEYDYLRDEKFDLFESFGVSFGKHSRISESGVLFYNSFGILGQFYETGTNSRIFLRLGFSGFSKNNKAMFTLMPLGLELRNNIDFQYHYGFLFSYTPFGDSNDSPFGFNIKYFSGFLKDNEESIEIGLTFQINSADRIRLLSGL